MLGFPTLRIKICPEVSGLPLYSLFWGWDSSTIKPTTNPGRVWILRDNSSTSPTGPQPSKSWPDIPWTPGLVSLTSRIQNFHGVWNNPNENPGSLSSQSKNPIGSMENGIFTWHDWSISIVKVGKYTRQPWIRHGSLHHPKFGEPGLLGNKTYYSHTTASPESLKIWE